jgi:hypothetical protein
MPRQQIYVNGLDLKQLRELDRRNIGEAIHHHV